MTYFCLVVAAALAFVQGQGIAHNHGTHAEVHGDIGVYNGQLVALDDITDISRLNSFTRGLGLTQGQWSFNRQLNGGLVLRGVRFGTDGTGFIDGAVGGVGVASGLRLPKCQRRACKKQRIPASCRYTPVLRSLSGQYCLGCPENVCTVHKPSRKNNSRQRRRQRKRQQQLCKLFGQCFGLNKNGRNLNLIGAGSSLVKNSVLGNGLIGNGLLQNGLAGRNIIDNRLIDNRFPVLRNGLLSTSILNNRRVGNGFTGSNIVDPRTIGIRGSTLLGY